MPSSPLLRTLVACLMFLLTGVDAAHAGVLFGLDSNLGGGYRWDAASRTISGRERSLDGGIRYSLEGGSFTSFRNQFTWQTIPSVADFTTAVQQSFDAWTVVDPATRLGTSLSFVPDLQTAVVGTPGFGGIDPAGAEIDLFGENAGDSGTRGFTQFSLIVSSVTLTSGSTNYGGAAGRAFNGADISLNSNSGAVYSLDLFRRLLTHEIGHAIGLGDVEDYNNVGFIDDNYDGSNNATANATLNNSWALLIDPLDPSASTGITKHAAGTVSTGQPGIATPGVDILLEGNGLGLAAGNPIGNLTPLTNDDFAMRQFLYPAFPNPLEGDFDDDGDVDFDDLNRYSGNLNQPATGALAPLNLDNDDTITLADHDLFVTQLLQTPTGAPALLGDLNLDGDVDVSQVIVEAGTVTNIGDASVLLAQLGTTSNGRYETGDLNADGDVDISQVVVIGGQASNLGDASRLLANLGASQSTAASRSSASTVPEPSTLTLIALTGTLTASRRRRR